MGGLPARAALDSRQHRANLSIVAITAMEQGNVAQPA
jgi:hypothetical protein